MNIELKKSLYESIMKNVAKLVKRTLNEKTESPKVNNHKKAINESNMSYCQFENTNEDLKLCLRTVTKANENEMLLDLNDYEKYAFPRLYETAQEFIEAYEEYEENKENYSDGEDDYDEDEDF